MDVIASGVEICPWGLSRHQPGLYRWFAETGAKPLYAFGHGLTYTTFEYRDLKIGGGDTVRATFTVTNTGNRPGTDVPQVYLTGAPNSPRMRLLGFEQAELEPGESRQVSVTADPRLLARFDGQARQWHITKRHPPDRGGQAADSPGITGQAVLTEALFGR